MVSSSPAFAFKSGTTWRRLLEEVKVNSQMKTLKWVLFLNMLFSLKAFQEAKSDFFKISFWTKKNSPFFVLGKLPSGSLINRRGILLLKTQERICLLANLPTKISILLTLEKRTGNTCMTSRHYSAFWKLNFICIVKIYIQSQLSPECLAEPDMCIKIFWKRISGMVERCSSEWQLSFFFSLHEAQ